LSVSSFYAEIPEDPKSRSSSRHAGGSGSDESLNTSGNTLTSGNLTKDQTSLSHPDLTDIQKTRALTLPARGFRTGKEKNILQQTNLAPCMEK